MIDNKKIVICIPAGRQRYLEVLIKFLATIALNSSTSLSALDGSFSSV